MAKFNHEKLNRQVATRRPSPGRSTAWRDKRPTVKQRTWLAEFGLECPETRGEACDLLAVEFSRPSCPECEERGLAADDHVLICRHCGYEFDPSEPGAPGNDTPEERHDYTT